MITPWQTTAFLCLLTFLMASCQPPNKTDSAPSLITKNATTDTHALYKNLSKLSENHLLFGHQNTTAYGVNWVDENNRSDVKDITGSYPAVFGWDVGHLKPGKRSTHDATALAFIRNEIINTYNRGGISTVSWHMANPITGESSWSKDSNVSQLIPGGEKHHLLKDYLDLFINFNNTLLVDSPSGKQHAAPIIFRPWHEHNGDWFWWGKGSTSEAEFIALWRFTVHYLRDQKGLRNLIFAFSPDRSRMNPNNFIDSYLYAYPGDDYVDILGIDNYWDLGHPENTASLKDRRKHFVQSLEAVATLAKMKNKISALTEGGQETIQQELFWTDMILNNILTSKTGQNIAYFLVWRNANRAQENREHYYAPYIGHKSEEDFRLFYESPFTLFEDQLPNMYQ